MRAALIVLCVVLAGCSGVTAPGTPESTVTPAPVPSDAPVAAADVPGISQSGVTDADALFEAHAAHFADYPAYSATRVVTLTYRFENGTTYTLTHVSRSNRTRSANTWRGRVPYAYDNSFDRSVWQNDSLMAIYDRETGDVTVRMQAAGSLLLFSPSIPLDFVPIPTLVAREDARPVARQSQNGTTTFVLRARGLTTNTVTDVDRGFAEPDPEVRNYRAGLFERRGPGRLEAVVTEKGLVRSVELTVPARGPGGNMTISARIAYRKVGSTSAPRPDWVTNATG